MHYYSNATEMEKFDYVDHFGVSFGDPDFMNNSIKNTDKIGVPVGKRVLTKLPRERVAEL